MGLYEMDFVNQQQIEARFGPPYPVRKFTKDEVDEQWKKILPKPEFFKIEPLVPCAMDRAYEDWVARGGKGTFSIMLVCHCPKCSSYSSYCTY